MALVEGEGATKLPWVEFLAFGLEGVELVFVELTGDYAQGLLLELLLEIFDEGEQDARVLLGAQDGVGLAWVGDAVAEDESWLATIFQKPNQWLTYPIRKLLLPGIFIKYLIKGIRFGDRLGGIIECDSMSLGVNLDVGFFFMNE